MVCLFPTRIDYRPFPDLYDAITWTEAHALRSLDKVDMCPLVAMAVHVIGYFAQEYPFVAQYAMGFGNERWIHGSEAIPLLP